MSGHIGVHGPCSIIGGELEMVCVCEGVITLLADVTQSGLFAQSKVVEVSADWHIG